MSLKQESFITEISSNVGKIGVSSDWKVKVKEMRDIELIGTQEQNFNLDISAIVLNTTFIDTVLSMSDGYSVRIQANKIPLLSLTIGIIPSITITSFQVEFLTSLSKNGVEISEFDTMIPFNIGILETGETQELKGAHTHNDVYVCGDDIYDACERVISEWGNTKEQLEELINKSIGNSQYKLDKATDRAEHLTIIKAMGGQ